MKKRLFLSFILFLSLTGCDKTGCNLEYFQAVSSIKLPEDTGIIDCQDNLEWTVQAIFQLPDIDLWGFISENEFQPVEKSTGFESNLFILLPKKHRQPPDTEQLYSVAGTNDGRTNWSYILDKKTGKLWAHINYPDWGGT